MAFYDKIAFYDWIRFRVGSVSILRVITGIEFMIGLS